MSEEQIVQNCSPTLAGLKTGNLFSCVYTNKEQILSDIANFNQNMQIKGIQMVPLKFMRSRVLIYVFRPKMLENDLNSFESKEILRKFGYKEENIYECLNNLKFRLCSCNSFPHEIGLFLSYPPEDVTGFIANNGNNYKYTGLWKVYGDEIKAKETFCKYIKCTNKYRSLLNKGYSVFDLAV